MHSLFSPVVAMLHNQKLNRWHPILYVESPLPGPPTPEKPIRHKSKGHHTTGFETREAALTSARELAMRAKEHSIGNVRLAVEEDLPWDGNGIPADTAFFINLSETTAKRAF